MEGGGPFQRSSPIQEKMEGVGEAVSRIPTRSFNIYIFLKWKMCVGFTSISAPKFKTTRSLAQGICFNFIGGSKNSYQ